MATTRGRCSSATCPPTPSRPSTPAFRCDCRLHPDDIATVLNRNVGAYFDMLSNGVYRPRFSAGGEVTIAAADEPQACVDQAIAAASNDAHGVIVVADAEHNADKPGGFANPGSGAPQPAVRCVGDPALGVCRRRRLRSRLGRPAADGSHRARDRPRPRLAAQRLRRVAEQTAPQRPRRDEQQRRAPSRASRSTRRARHAGGQPVGRRLVAAVRGDGDPAVGGSGRARPIERSSRHPAGRGRAR